MYSLKGEIKVIGDVQQVSDKFKKRDVVIVDKSGQYEQIIQLQFAQDRCDVLDKFKVGDNVSVDWFLRGREWTNPKDGVVKVFNTLDAWKMEAINGTIEPTKAADPVIVAEGDDDLPF